MGEVVNRGSCSKAQDRAHRGQERGVNRVSCKVGRGFGTNVFTERTRVMGVVPG